MKSSIILLVCFILILAVSCNKNKDPEAENAVLGRYLHIPKTPYNYAHPDLPAFFNNQFVTIQDNTPADNRITDWGATLGRVLFYDTRLSGNYSISCASCHKQAFGFTDTA